MYKVGDRVETYKEIRSLKGAGPRHVKGRIVEVHADTLTISFDEPWPSGAMQLVFLTKDLLATDVLRLKVGDKVCTGHGDVATVLSCPSNPGQIAVRLAGGRHTSFYSLSALTKVDDPDEGGQRWSFKSNKDTFDGARVIRELLNAGADYAVVTVDGATIGLLHEQLAKRAEAVGALRLADCTWSCWQIATFKTDVFQPRFAYTSADNGYRVAFRQGGNVTTENLALMLKDLEMKEAEAKQFVTHVEWGKATRD